MRLLRSLAICAICCLIICESIEDCSGQNKFEIGGRFDALIIPLNIDTYHESGLGYYDINAKGNITQAGYVDFTYWPFANWGASIGMGIRRFSSQINYAIPDPSNLDHDDIVFENSYPFTASALGPVVSFLVRKDHLRARLGYGLFDLSNQKYTSRSGSSAVIISNGTEILAEIQLDEESYWRQVPTGYGLLQFDAQYNIIDNVFLKLGFETTLSGRNFYPYTLKITGFTANTTKEDHVLNDFKIRNTYASFSTGVGYIIGFGKYNRIKNEERN